MKTPQSVPKHNGVRNNFIMGGQRRWVMLIHVAIPALGPRRRWHDRSTEVAGKIRKDREEKKGGEEEGRERAYDLEDK